ncbi:unnamed protein product [Protopolystoma xenopodis]|uniref:Uncharacterized protein n=1 Tax=Protopolystoma xenopodis TaxID=117903 RepID=A0A3S5A2M9_9PLAT|nr:unnamed protein product [Protopolystoma xenopodis]
MMKMTFMKAIRRMEITIKIAMTMKMTMTLMLMMRKNTVYDVIMPTTRKMNVAMTTSC